MSNQPPIPTSGFPRRELFRLMSMLMMLAVVGMLIYRTRDPAMWRWLADDDSPVSDGSVSNDKNGTAKSKPTESGLASEPSVASTDEIQAANETLVSGPNDLQAYEQTQAEYQFQAISDKAPLTAEEMPAYWRLMRWSMTQSFDELWERARKDRYFTHLGETPAKHRGELIALKLSLRRSLAHDDSLKNSAGVEQIYEAWGVTKESRTWPYCVVFYDKPPQLPLGPNIHEEAEFVGYFLKLFSYEDALGVTRWVPLLIGRLRWQENPARTLLREQRAGETWWTWAIVGLAAVIFGAALLWSRQRLTSSDPVDHQSIERWLEAGIPDNSGSTTATTSEILADWNDVPTANNEFRPASLPNLTVTAESGAASQQSQA